LRRARRLLDLTRAVGGATTLDDLAQRMADATRDLTGCDQASVLLPDDAGLFRVVGVAAPESTRASILDRAPLPAGLDELPDVKVVRADDASDLARRALAALGLGAVGLVAATAGDWRIIVSAEWHEVGSLPPLADVTASLRTLADLAADALDRVVLLDTTRRQALHDALTGLPNQVLFADRAAHAVTRARRNGERLAIGVLDLDRFKTVNDSLGHGAGDALLVEVAARLEQAVRGHDTVARMGGDEFTLLLPDLHPHGEAIVAERLLAAFEAPFVIDGHAIHVSPSIGLASFPDDGDTPERLLRSADAAMYRAKDNGRNTWATYASGMSERAYDRLTLEADLHGALDRHELRIGFEPIVRTADRAAEGVAALVRWSHPAFGVLEPREFLPIGEEIGLAPKIDTWVIGRACRELARAGATGAGPAWVSVSVSLRTLAQPTLLATVADALTAAGLSPDRLMVTVPEAVGPASSAEVLGTLAALRAAGVTVALDNFGRASAPLGSLAELPVDVLVLDRSLLRTVQREDDDAPVLAAVVTMAHELGLRLVADGVDDEARLAVATRLGCDLARGSFVGRAQPGVTALEADAPSGAIRLVGE
jgi:diguanylate cyclase (GGDEF)-like protein